MYEISKKMAVLVLAFSIFFWGETFGECLNARRSATGSISPCQRKQPVIACWNTSWRRVRMGSWWLGLDTLDFRPSNWHQLTLRVGRCFFPFGEDQHCLTHMFWLVEPPTSQDVLNMEVMAKPCLKRYVKVRFLKIEQFVNWLRLLDHRML